MGCVSSTVCIAQRRGQSFIGRRGGTVMSACVRRSLALLLVALLATGLLADDTSGERLTEAMRALARQTAVSRNDAGTTAAATLLPQPVFRYSDQPRRILDATLWLWSAGGRPLALQKIEAVTRSDRPAWTVCFASVSEERLSTRWPDGRVYEATGGVQFAPLPDPPPVPPSNPKLKRHLRQVARRFAAEIINAPDGSNVEQMRLLPRPIHEYGGEDSELRAGAIFGFACNGTNPDAYVLIEVLEDEAGDPRWRYGFARMTTGGLRFTLDGRDVWSAEWVHPVSKAFDSWTFFFQPRE
jgi:hypothetical protein